MDKAKRYSREINLLQNNNNIDDKLSIILLYNEFKNDLLCKDRRLWPYNSVMYENFETIVNYMNDKNEHISGINFMKLFFFSLNHSDMKKNPVASNTINLHKNHMVDFLNNFNIARIIDDINNIDFNDKVNILLTFRDYFNMLCLNIVYKYGDDKNLIFGLYDVLEFKLKSYLKTSIKDNKDIKLITNDLVPVMKASAVDYLVYKLPSSNSSNYNMYNDVLNKEEQKLSLFLTAYDLVNIDSSKKEVEENNKKICDELGISENEFFHTTLAINKKILSSIMKDKNNKKR